MRVISKIIIIKKKNEALFVSYFWYTPEFAESSIPYKGESIQLTNKYVACKLIAAITIPIAKCTIILFTYRLQLYTLELCIKIYYHI